MKKALLLLLFPCCVFSAFSQKKATFGLVVKAGNYTLPYRHTLESEYYNGQRTARQVDSQTAGETYSFGVNGSLRLGGHFRISSELLYRVASYSFGTDQELYEEPNSILFAASNQRQQIAESSLFLPLKIQFSFLKDGRTTVAFGAGVFKVLNASANGRWRQNQSGLPARNADYQLPSLDINNNDGKPEMAFIAGVFHRIDSNTTLGLEFNYERRAESKLFFSRYAPNTELAFLSYGYFGFISPSMRSLSLSLSHNLVR